jgi:hypothetical protein
VTIGKDKTPVYGMWCVVVAELLLRGCCCPPPPPLAPPEVDTVTPLSALHRFDPGFGYHVDNTTGIATGNDPESIYAVMSGKNFNGGCVRPPSAPTLRSRCPPADGLTTRAPISKSPAVLRLWQLRDGRPRRRRWRNGSDIFRQRPLAWQYRRWGNGAMGRG